MGSGDFAIRQIYYKDVEQVCSILDGCLHLQKASVQKFKKPISIDHLRFMAWLRRRLLLLYLPSCNLSTNREYLRENLQTIRRKQFSKLHMKQFNRWIFEDVFEKNLLCRQMAIFKISSFMFLIKLICKNDAC